MNRSDPQTIKRKRLARHGRKKAPLDRAMPSGAIQGVSTALNRKPSLNG